MKGLCLQLQGHLPVATWDEGSEWVGVERVTEEHHTPAQSTLEACCGWEPRACRPYGLDHMPYFQHHHHAQVPPLEEALAGDGTA